MIYTKEKRWSYYFPTVSDLINEYSVEDYPHLYLSFQHGLFSVAVSKYKKGYALYTRGFFPDFYNLDSVHLSDEFKEWHKVFYSDNLEMCIKKFRVACLNLLFDYGFNFHGNYIDNV
ncbi:hypothetical protein [Capybara microvirus Cap1_SP_95]|nr:hypothetical protein [Capybara microvirus Cap1_SP_95]